MGHPESHKWRAPLLYVVGGLSAAGIYEYQVAVNRGAISQQLDGYITNAWFVLGAVMSVVYARYLERHALGTFVTEKFMLEPEERTLFEGKFMSGEYYPSANDFDPQPRLRDMFRTPPYAVRGLLKLHLTDRRLVIGMVFGHTWRVIPLASIRRLVDVAGKYPYRHALLVEYDFEGRTEAILTWTKSVKGKAFSKALRAVTSHIG